MHGMLNRCDRLEKYGSLSMIGAISKRNHKVIHSVMHTNLKSPKLCLPTQVREVNGNSLACIRVKERSNILPYEMK